MDQGAGGAPSLHDRTSGTPPPHTARTPGVALPLPTGGGSMGPKRGRAGMLGAGAGAVEPLRREMLPHRPAAGS